MTIDAHAAMTQEIDANRHDLEGVLPAGAVGSVIGPASVALCRSIIDESIVNRTVKKSPF